MFAGIKDKDDNIIVRDYFENVEIREITLYQLNNTIIGIEALYEGEMWGQERGNKILAIPKNKETQSQTYKISSVGSLELALKE